MDGKLSFNVAASVARAHHIIDAYKQKGVGPERMLTKIVSTWQVSVIGRETDCAPPHEKQLCGQEIIHW